MSRQLLMVLIVLAMAFAATAALAAPATSPTTHDEVSKSAAAGPATTPASFHARAPGEAPAAGREATPHPVARTWPDRGVYVATNYGATTGPSVGFSKPIEAVARSVARRGSDPSAVLTGFGTKAPTGIIAATEAMPADLIPGRELSAVEKRLLCGAHWATWTTIGTSTTLNAEYKPGTALELTAPATYAKVEVLRSNF